MASAYWVEQVLILRNTQVSPAPELNYIITVGSNIDGTTNTKCEATFNGSTIPTTGFANCRLEGKYFTVYTSS
jgi:hypothetical protein